MTIADTVERLAEHTAACAFAKADITALAKRLRAGEAGPPPEGDDAAALKVEKNALALVFIPTVMNAAEAFLAERPGLVFVANAGRLDAHPAAQLRALAPAANPVGAAALWTGNSLKAVFRHLATQLLDPAGNADPLLARYGAALGDYNRHTPHSKTHFTPPGHFMAGIDTALFFILRVLSGLVVLGEARDGQRPDRAFLAAGMRNAQPLLLAVARCHLEQLLALEGPLGKYDPDPFRMGGDGAALRAVLDGIFDLAEGPAGPRLELKAALLDLPPMESPKPRTGCPALYASTADNVNAIVALARLTERCFTDLLYEPEG